MTEQLSISERIVEVILCRLRGIRKADGFRTDAGLRVYDSRRSVDPTDLPAIVLFDGDENATASSGSSRSYDNALQITIEAHVECDKAETGRELRALKADIKKAVMVNRGDLTDERGCMSQGALGFNSARSTSRQDGDISESVLFTFTAYFKEGYGDPYRQL